MVIELPLSTKVGTAVQSGCWLSWLLRNTRKLGAEFNLLIPREPLLGLFELFVMLRSIRTEDFVVLSTDRHQVRQIVGAGPMDFQPQMAGREGFLAEIRARIPQERATLADLARVDFPKPLVGRT